MGTSVDDGRRMRYLVGTTVYAIATMAMYIAFAVAVLAILYLLYGIFFGGLAGFDQLPRADKLRVQGNLSAASSMLATGLGVGSICAAFVFWYEELTGYLTLIVAGAIGWGVPWAVTEYGGQKGTAIEMGLVAFAQAALVPAAVGAVLIVKDVLVKIVGAVQAQTNRMESSGFQYGGGAQRETKPIRTSLLGKCWEGPYCRDQIRPHCPIFQAKQACWKVRRGCYCEEDIVTQASAKIHGIVLEMAPAAQYNFANSPNPGAVRRQELTEAQKAERCRHCVIYNEHQREKYRLVMPLTLVGGAGVCYLLSPVLHGVIGRVLGSADSLLARFSYLPNQTNPAKFIDIGSGAIWALVVAVSIIIISKILQIVEWMIFEKQL